MKKLLQVSLLFVFGFLILFLSIKGISGNPSAGMLNSAPWKEEGPFELSPERGRYSLLYSLIENNSVQFSVPIARFVAPDVAYSDGNYVSLFAPALSYLAIPGYLIGRSFGISQVGAFFVVSLFAVFNMLLIRTIVNKLTGSSLSGTISGLIFLLATPAFSYAGTLYQHHISTFLILFSIYALMKSQSILSIAVVLFLCAFSIPLDSPNAIFLLPIALYALSKLIQIERIDEHVKVSFRYLGVFSLIFATIPFVLLAFYNVSSHGQPFKLSGVLQRAEQIDESGNPVKIEEKSIKDEGGQLDEIEGMVSDKNVSGFFKTRNLLNGVYVHTLSLDRGVLFFTPVVLFGLLGFLTFPKNQKEIKAVIAGTMFAVLLLYSLWGDPWGGWAFGDRYMIPTYALLCIFLGTSLKYITKSFILSLLFALILSYSLGVNALGAVTTNANPPYGEAIALSEISGKVEKYGIDRNWEYLNTNGSKSFFYRTYLSPSVSPQAFYWFIVITNLSVIMTLYLIYIYKFHTNKL